jgi:acyl-CoA hydrolase
MTAQGKTIAQSRVVLSNVMGPQDTNIHGNIHGGVIMKMVDEVGALAAVRHARMPVVTIVIDSMTFLEPIRVGNLVTCAAELTWVGRSSIEVRVEVTAENPLTGTMTHTNGAYLVYVALSPDGRPAPVPPLIYTNDQERQRAQQAEARQAARKQRRSEEGGS